MLGSFRTCPSMVLRWADSWFSRLLISFSSLVISDLLLESRAVESFSRFLRVFSSSLWQKSSSWCSCS